MTGYFLFALLSAFLLALQGALMASHFRREDSLSVVGYRGLSLGISFAPLLFFVPSEAFLVLPSQSSALVLAGFIGAVACCFAGLALQQLTVALMNTVGFSAVALTSLFIDIQVYERSFSVYQLGLVAALFLSLFFFSAGNREGGVLKEGNLLRGVLFAILFGSLIGISGAIVGELSKKSHPLAVGYFYELLIGVCAILLCLIRKAAGGSGISKISSKTFRAILVHASPTAAATGFHLYALTIGPLAIVSALQSTIMVFSLFFGAFFYKEEFGPRELGLLAVITAIIIGLRFVS